MGALGILILFAATPAGAQTLETVGGRALGMGGAFVAVADDASAVVWNPAALVSGGPAALTIEWAGFRFGNQTGAPAPRTGQRDQGLLAVATWPLGFGVTRSSDTRIAAVTDAGTRVASLTTTQAGVTVLQTLVEGLTVGATVKWVRGTASDAVSRAASGESALSAVDTATGVTRNTIDVDLGVLADLGRLRLGLVARNLRAPVFATSSGFEMPLSRRVRAGLSVAPRDGLTLALDADMDTAVEADGPRRMIALGAEQTWTTGWAARAGVRWNVRDAAPQPVWTAGGSVRVTARWWLDVHGTFGSRAGDRGVGAAVRAGF